MSKSKRSCIECGNDISELPSYYSYCSDCFREKHTGSSNGGGKATAAQVKLLLALKDEGYVGDDVNFKGLSIAAASSLIDEALAQKRRE